MKRLWIALLIVLSLMLIACDPAPPPEWNCPSGPTNSQEARIFEQVNALRVYFGQPSLGWNSTLACNARGHAEYMRDTGTLFHQDLYWRLINDPLYVNYAALGENILVGPGNLSGDAIEDSWLRSAGHLNNILGWWDSIGIAIVWGPDGRLWAVQEFGRHR